MHSGIEGIVEFRLLSFGLEWGFRALVANCGPRCEPKAIRSRHELSCKHDRNPISPKP